MRLVDTDILIINAADTTPEERRKRHGVAIAASSRRNVTVPLRHKPGEASNCRKLHETGNPRAAVMHSGNPESP